MTKVSADNIFEIAHSYLKKKMYVELLGLIISTKGELRKSAKADENHAWYLVGDAMFKLGRYKSAGTAFLRAYAADSDDDQAALAAGNSFFEQGDLRSAEVWMRRAYELSGDAEPGYNLANVMYDLVSYRVAIAIYKSLKPETPGVAAKIKTKISLARKNLRKSSRRRKLRCDC